MLFFTAFRDTLSIFRRDRSLLIFSTIPVAIGCVLYYFLGSWLYTSVLQSGKAWIVAHVGQGGWSVLLSYLLIFFLTLLLILAINWTFILLVSLLGGPLNAFMSLRVEMLIFRPGPADQVSGGLAEYLKRLTKMILNELKKIFLIVGLAVFSLALSLIPFLIPLSMAISALLFAFSMLDYSWSRHDLEMRECLADLTSSPFTYLLSGIFFLVLIAIPLINLFALPFAFVYYTTIFCNKRAQSHGESR